MGDSTKKALSKSAVRVAAMNAKSLFQDECGTDFRKVAETVPMFAAELSAQIVQRLEG